MTGGTFAAASGLPDRLPPVGNAWLHALVAVIFSLAILCSTLWLPLAADTQASMAERIVRMDALFAALPDYVKSWMSFQRFVFLSSVWFVIWHRVARVYLLGIVLSHVISYTEIAFAPVERLDLGLVSLNHLVWLPAFALMLRNRSRLEPKTPYWLWVHFALFQLTVSMVFDVPDSIAYLTRTYF